MRASSAHLSLCRTCSYFVDECPQRSRSLMLLMSCVLSQTLRAMLRNRVSWCTEPFSVVRLLSFVQTGQFVLNCSCQQSSASVLLSFVSGAVDVDQHCLSIVRPCFHHKYRSDTKLSEFSVPLSCCLDTQHGFGAGFAVTPCSAVAM